MTWWMFALLSAVFAAATSILGKVGVKDIDSTLATAIRTIVVLLLAWVIVFATGKQKGLGAINQHSLMFLIFSGVATGLSWLCFYRALQMADASKVVPIDKLSLALTITFAVTFLGEALTWKTALGALMIVAGTFVVAL